MFLAIFNPEERIASEMAVLRCKHKHALQTRLKVKAKLQNAVIAWKNFKLGKAFRRWKEELKLPPIWMKYLIERKKLVAMRRRQLAAGLAQGQQTAAKQAQLKGFQVRLNRKSIQQVRMKLLASDRESKQLKVKQLSLSLRKGTQRALSTLKLKKKQFADEIRVSPIRQASTRILRHVIF